METGTRRVQIDEERMEAKTDTISKDGGEKISKEIMTEHTQVDRTKVRQVLVGAQNGGGSGARQEASENANMNEITLVGRRVPKGEYAGWGGKRSAICNSERSATNERGKQSTL